MVCPSSVCFSVTFVIPCKKRFERFGCHLADTPGQSYTSGVYWHIVPGKGIIWCRIPGQNMQLQIAAKPSVLCILCISFMQWMQMNDSAYCQINLVFVVIIITCAPKYHRSHKDMRGDRRTKTQRERERETDKQARRLRCQRGWSVHLRYSRAYSTYCEATLRQSSAEHVTYACLAALINSQLCWLIHSLPQLTLSADLR